MNTLKLLTVAICLGVPAVLLGCSNSAGANLAKANISSSPASPAATASPTPGGTGDQLTASRELYKTNCAECHKETGKGGEAVVDGKKLNAKDLTGDKMAKRSDAKLYDDIAEGSPDDGMPAFKDKLSEAQINDIVKYIRIELQHSSANANSK